MTENGIKDGDKVALVDNADAVGVVRYAGKNTCIVDFGLGDSTVGYDSIVRIGRRTAFLTELKGLLERYDAGFTDSDDYRLYAFVGDDGFYWEMNENNGYVLNADNIMDFEKD